MAIEDFQRHAQAAKGDLLAQFKDKANFETLLEALTERCNELDAALVDLVTERTVDAAVGAQLDQLAAVVAIDRGSSDDDELRARIKAEIRLNRSEGTVEDLLEILTLVLGTSGHLAIAEHPPASMLIEVAPTAIPDIIADLIARGRLAGVGASLVHSETPASGVFTFGATDTLVDTTTQGFASGDSLDTGTGGVFADIMEA